MIPIYEFTDPEYRRIMHIIEGIGDIGKRLFCSAVLRYQLAMGARVDDTAKLSKTNIKCNSEPALEQLSLTTKLCWSKNIQEEKQGMYVYDVVVRIIIYYCRHLTLSFILSLFQYMIKYCLEPVTLIIVFFLVLLVSWNIPLSKAGTSLLIISFVLTASIVLLLSKIECQQS